MGVVVEDHRWDIGRIYNHQSVIYDPTPVADYALAIILL